MADRPMAADRKRVLLSELKSNQTTYVGKKPSNQSQFECVKNILIFYRICQFSGRFFHS